jgi:tetratricopeptide (TPR) repeat protein
VLSETTFAAISLKWRRLVDVAGIEPATPACKAFLHYLLGVGYEARGTLPEAISEYQKAMKMWDGPNAAVALAHAYSAAGRKAEANKILRDLQRKSERTSVPPYTMATIYAGLGENDKAFEFLEKARSEKSLDISLFLKSDLLLDDLRPDPRFQSLLRGMALKN